MFRLVGPAQLLKSGRGRSVGVRSRCGSAFLETIQSDGRGQQKRQVRAVQGRGPREHHGKDSDRGERLSGDDIKTTD